MRKEKFFEEFSCSEFIEYIHSVISKYEVGNVEKYVDIKKDISVLENRINDENLYLGVVGSFSSGKSTFINSVIHKNFLPTDAVQGTTVAASVLKRADYDDFEITYLDGTSKRYSKCASELLSRYQIQSSSTDLSVVETVSVWKKILNWLKKLFGIAIVEKSFIPRTDERISLFKKIVATEDMAKDVQYVTLYYQNNNIPYRIAMVDTPGTESLNKRHSDVTKNAIDNICDAIVVIIPYDEPVSEELLNYVNTHLEQQKKECIFVVTKVELLGDRDELPQLIGVIKKRLENGLGIDTACVIPMPTLVYLKAVDPEMQTTFLDNIPELERTELIQMYEDGIKKINEILSTKRIEYIKKKIINICKRVSTKLSINLSDVVNDYDEKNKQLLKETVMPLNSFEGKARQDIKSIVDSYQQRVRGEIGFVNICLSGFRSEIERTLDGCSDSQDLCNHMEFYLSTIFDDITLEVSKQLSKQKEGINSKLHDLQKDFEKEYNRCGVKCKKLYINISAVDFYSKEFISECESIFQDCTRSVVESIRSDTNGFFKKVKAFFTNPYGKHKELAMTELSGVIDKLNLKISEYTIQHIKDDKLEKAKGDADNKIHNMVDVNRHVVEAYVNRTNQSLNSNNKNRESTQACINRLNEYIRQMKEVG